MAIITAGDLSDLGSQRAFRANGSTVTLKKISETDWILFGDLAEGDSEGFPYDEIPDPPYIEVGNSGDTYYGFARQGSTSVAGSADFGSIVPYHASAWPGDYESEDYTIQQVLYYAPNRSLAIQIAGSPGIPFGTATINGRSFNRYDAAHIDDSGVIRWDNQDNPFADTRFATLQFWGEE